MTTDDLDLLWEYAGTQSEEAFATLVSRHINLVYSVALHQLRDHAAAEEVAQAVFIILARKAGSVGPRTILSAWLCRTAQYAAANVAKADRRRKDREQEIYMQSLSDQSQPENSPWSDISPLLNTAMAELGEKDHSAIVLRFFEGKNMKEIGAALGVNENAATTRVSRAVEKLRKFFVKRGINLSTAALGGAISSNSIQAAPVSLAKAVTVAALTKGATASGSTLAVIKGALKLMAWSKAKVAILVGAGVLLTAGTMTVLVTQPETPRITDDMWMADWNGIKKLPPVLVLRPSQFLDKPSGIMAEGKYVYRNQEFAQIFSIAYPGIGSPRCVQKVYVPAAGYRFEKPGMPKLTNGWDLMLTLTNHPIEALQREIKRQFGFVGRHETVETNVLSLTMARSAAPGLKTGQGVGHPMDVGGQLNPISGYSITNAETLGNLASQLEWVFGKPVLDQTDLKGFYDVSLTWDWRPLAAAAGQSAEMQMKLERKLVEQSLLDQLGLKLVPSREPVEMLVIESAKN